MCAARAQACGNKSDVDMRHKLNTFILKNPPEEKVSKAEKRCAFCIVLRHCAPTLPSALHCRNRHNGSSLHQHAKTGPLSNTQSRTDARRVLTCSN